MPSAGPENDMRGETDSDILHRFEIDAR